MLMVFNVYTEDHKYSQEFVENYMAINIIPVIKRVPGVGDAMVMGADYSMRIWLKPDVMAQYGLMPTDVTARTCRAEHRGGSPVHSANKATRHSSTR